MPRCIKRRDRKLPDRHFVAVIECAEWLRAARLGLVRMNIRRAICRLFQFRQTVRVICMRMRQQNDSRFNANLPYPFKDKVRVGGSVDNSRLLGCLAN